MPTIMSPNVTNLHHPLEVPGNLWDRYGHSPRLQHPKQLHDSSVARELLRRVGDVRQIGEIEEMPLLTVQRTNVLAAG
jgi:hypothetical protein